MWIRTQDRTQLINPSNFVLSVTPTGMVVATYDFSAEMLDVGILGIYKDSDRAIKVLDMIQHYLIIGTDKYVFDMPEE